MQLHLAPSTVALPMVMVDCKKIMKVHVDYLEENVHTMFREDMLRTTGYPGEFLYELNKVNGTFANACYDCKTGKFDGAFACECRHVGDKCQCNRPVVHIGQDECIFKQHSESSKEWTVHGQGKLHSKTDGKGEMVSGFQDSVRGSGRPTSAR